MEGYEVTPIENTLRARTLRDHDGNVDVITIEHYDANEGSGGDRNIGHFDNEIQDKLNHYPG